MQVCSAQMYTQKVREIPALRLCWASRDRGEKSESEIMSPGMFVNARVYYLHVHTTTYIYSYLGLVLYVTARSLIYNTSP